MQIDLHGESYIYSRNGNYVSQVAFYFCDVITISIMQDETFILRFLK